MEGFHRLQLNEKEYTGSRRYATRRRTNESKWQPISVGDCDIRHKFTTEIPDRSAEKLQSTNKT